MNIRLKAGLEITGFILSAMLIGALTKLSLGYLSGIYSERQVVEGICTVIGASFMGLLIKTLYDIRVAQLSYELKIKEMTTK
jgi:hypothetical protein